MSKGSDADQAAVRRIAITRAAYAMALTDLAAAMTELLPVTLGLLRRFRGIV